MKMKMTYRAAVIAALKARTEYSEIRRFAGVACKAWNKANPDKTSISVSDFFPITQRIIYSLVATGEVRKLYKLNVKAYTYLWYENVKDDSEDDGNDAHDDVYGGEVVDLLNPNLANANEAQMAIRDATDDFAEAVTELVTVMVTAALAKTVATTVQSEVDKALKSAFNKIGK